MTAISISSENLKDLYLAYRSVGPSADLIVPAVALYLVALVGIMLNGTVLPSVFALNCSIMAMLCAAIDRFFAVISPFKHFSIFIKYKFPYLLGHLFICTIYGAFTLIYMFAFALENAEDQTTGFLGDILHYSLYLFNGCTFVLCFCSVFFYVAIFVIIRCKNGVSQQTNARVLRSMLIILLINIVGYLFGTAIYLFIIVFDAKIFESPIRIWQFTFIGSILLNAAGGSNAIVLYFSSVDYRQAYKNKFSAFFCRSSQNNTVKIIQVRNLNPGNNKIRPAQMQM